MEIRVSIGLDGHISIESISMLEDLWHDYRYFRARADVLDQEWTPTGHLVAKRYSRAALLILMCYFEGVVNHWLKELLSADEWRRIEASHEHLHVKVDRVQERLLTSTEGRPNIRKAKDLRNDLAHLKPGSDGRLYDQVCLELLEHNESTITKWFDAVEESLKLKRHPDTRQESQPLRDALGTELPGHEGYTSEE